LTTDQNPAEKLLETEASSSLAYDEISGLSGVSADIQGVMRR